MLVISLLVLSACAAFAVIMTNGPDYRAVAQPEASGGIRVGVPADAPGVGEPVGFTAALPDGPVQIGKPGRLVITVTNPTADPLVVDDLTIDVLEPSRPGCRADWFSVGFDDRQPAVVTVPAGESVRVSVTYRLVDLAGINQDACQGATFPLSISGTGRPV